MKKILAIRRGLFFIAEVCRILTRCAFSMKKVEKLLSLRHCVECLENFIANFFDGAKAYFCWCGGSFMKFKILHE